MMFGQFQNHFAPFCVTIFSPFLSLLSTKSLPPLPSFFLPDSHRHHHRSLPPSSSPHCLNVIIPTPTISVHSPFHYCRFCYSHWWCCVAVVGVAQLSLLSLLLLHSPPSAAHGAAISGHRESSPLLSPFRSPPSASVIPFFLPFAVPVLR